MKELKVNFKPSIKKLEVFSKKGIAGALSGSYRSAFKGSGLEFDRYRQYDSSNDDASRIDWKTSQRSRYLVVKEFVEERNANILFFVDASSSMSFGSRDKLKNEYVAEMVASLSFAILQAGDNAGLVMFSDDLISKVVPTIGTKQFYMITRALAEPKNYEGLFELEYCTKQLMSWLPGPTTIIIVSDFIGLHGNWEKPFEVLATKHEVIAIIVRDPRDMVLPDEAQEVFIEDPYSQDQLLIDTQKSGPEYKQDAVESIKKLEFLFKKYSVDYLFIRTDEPYEQKLQSFFHERSAQWQ